MDTTFLKADREECVAIRVILKCFACNALHNGGYKNVLKSQAKVNLPRWADAPTDGPSIFIHRELCETCKTAIRERCKVTGGNEPTPPEGYLKAPMKRIHCPPQGEKGLTPRQRYGLGKMSQ